MFALLAAVAGDSRRCVAGEEVAPIGHSGRTGAVINCDCQGCRAYLDACEMSPSCEVWESDQCDPVPPSSAPSPYAPDRMTDAPPDADAGASPSIDAESDDRSPFSGPMPQLASAGAIGGSSSAAPHMIGDLFGVFGDGSSTILLDRLSVLASDIDALVPAPPNSPFTASESPSAVAVVDSQGTVIDVQPATAEFTTVGTTAELEAAIAADPSAQIPIVNNAGYQSIANDQFVIRNGAGGQTLFNSAGSYVVLQTPPPPPPPPFSAGNGEDYDATYAYDYVAIVPIGSLGGAPGANVGRQKITENGSSIPRDRIIDNFSYFKNTPLLSSGQDVTRNVVGFEKTFFDGMTSLEFRAPFASTLDNNVRLESTGLAGGTNTEFGNMILYGKLLLWEHDSYAIGAGLGVTMPTADDFVLRDAAGSEVLRVENESPHLLPYIGFVLTPASDLFWQGFVQVDVDTQGNGVSVSPFEDGAYTGDVEFVDRLRDKDLIYVDMSVGYWMHRDPQSRVITGLAPMFEVHYNGSISDGDALRTGTIQTSGDSSFDVVNGVVGTMIQFGCAKNLLLAYVAPLGGDEQFDGEFRMSFNWFFGPSARQLNLSTF